MIDPVWVIKAGHPELHCICSALGVLVISWFLYYNNPISRPIAYLIAATLIWTAGFLKEFTDADGFNMYELLGDTFGVMVGIVLFMMLFKKVRWACHGTGRYGWRCFGIVCEYHWAWKNFSKDNKYYPEDNWML